MKTIFFKTSSLFFALAIVLFACKKDDEEPTDNDPVETTVAEDKANITTALDGVITCIETMRDGDGVSSIVDFTGAQGGEAMNEEWMTEIMDSFDIAKLADTTGMSSGNISFTKNKGIYEWNDSSKEWTKSASSEGIIFKFPGTPDATSNNVEFKLSNYESQTVTIDEEDIDLPKNMACALTIDGIEIMSIDLDITHGDPIPNKASITMTLAPYTYTMTYEKTSDTQFDGSISFSTSGGCETSLTGTVKMLDADWENWDDESIDQILATFTLNELSLSGDIDVENIVKIGDDPTVNQINGFTDIAVNMNGVKIGNLKLVEDTNGDEWVNIVYKDGTEENTNIYYDPFLDDIEVALSPIFGSFDLNDNE